MWVKRQATPKEADAVKQLRLPGIEFVAESNRFYPNRGLAAHVLGFTGMDGKGMEGIEYFYDRHLRGTGTSVKVLKDAHGNGFQSEPPSDNEGAGKNIVLTLDHGIQFITETALNDAVESTRARSGMALVMEPRHRAPSSPWRWPRPSTRTPMRTPKRPSGATGPSPTPSSPARP